MEYLFNQFELVFREYERMYQNVRWWVNKGLDFSNAELFWARPILSGVNSKEVEMKIKGK